MFKITNRQSIAVGVFLVSLLASAGAKCWCRGYRTHHTDERSYSYQVNEGCNDHELQAVCQRGEDEIVDFIGSTMTYARTFGMNDTQHPRPQDAINQARLSYHIENRPRPDCATGLWTNTPLQTDQWQHYNPAKGQCYSAKLLDQCKGLDERIIVYIRNLTRAVYEDPLVEPYYAFLMAIRFNTEPPHITCEDPEYEHTFYDSGVSISPSFLLLCGIILVQLFSTIS